VGRVSPLRKGTPGSKLWAKPAPGMAAAGLDVFAWPRADWQLWGERRLKQTPRSAATQVLTRARARKLSFQPSPGEDGEAMVSGAAESCQDAFFRPGRLGEALDAGALLIGFGNDAEQLLKRAIVVGMDCRVQGRFDQVVAGNVERV